MKKIVNLCFMLLVVTVFLIGCKKTVTITFDTLGGSNVDAIEIDRDGVIDSLPTVTKTGYTFNGWYLNDVKVTTYTTFSSDATLSAQWITHANTVTFYDTDGVTLSVQTIYSGEAAVAPEYTAKDGYTFVGWDKSLSNIVADTNITVVCVEIQYSITFVSNGGSLVANINQVYNGEISIPKDPTRIGYFFAGWYTDVELTKLYKFETMPNYSFTLYAKWDEVGVDYVSSYLDIIYANKGSTPADYNLPTELTFEGKKFTIAWEVEVTEGNADVSIISGEGMVTIDVNENVSVACKYNLKATISDGSSTTTTTFSKVIPLE